MSRERRGALEATQRQLADAKREALGPIEETSAFQSAWKEREELQRSAAALTFEKAQLHRQSTAIRSKIAPPRLPKRGSWDDSLEGLVMVFFFVGGMALTGFLAAFTLDPAWVCAPLTAWVTWVFARRHGK